MCVSVREWLESMKRACVYKHVLRMCAYTMLIELLLHNQYTPYESQVRRSMKPSYRENPCTETMNCAVRVTPRGTGCTTMWEGETVILPVGTSAARLSVR